jgi:hypothetical protein
MSKLGHQIGIFRFDEESIETDNFEKIGRVVAFSGLKSTAEVVDSTEYSEDAEEWSDYEASKMDGGELSIGVRYYASSDQVERMAESHFSGTKEKLKILLPGIYNKRFIFDVLVTSVEFGTEKGAIKEITFTLKVTGKPDIGPLS